jgi:murein DD-endopeptidase MepM/ murein hydrolase activator NlpD
MKIILLKDSGSVKTIQCTRRRLAAGLAFALFASLLAAFALHSGLSSSSMDEALVTEWQMVLADQRSELQALQEKSAAEAQAVGRQLAGMQARLLRMEALGVRVTQVAELDEGEFSFDEPVAVGGPVATGESPLDWSELQSRLDTLAISLKDRETELEVLHTLLRDQEYRQATALTGRPVTWGWISSGFGKRVDPFSGTEAWHAGVDFAGRSGSETVAVASGVVTFAGKRSGYGKLVEINHGDGYVTRYGHHESLLVATGEIVKKGQPIGVMGSTGRSTGPHVHFEVLKHGRHVDPARYVVRR